MKETKFCIDCHSEIPKSACKCYECGSYQTGIQRTMGNSATILALIVSMISLSVLLIQNAHRFYRPSSNIVATLANIAQYNEKPANNEISLILEFGVHNAGNLPALFEKAETDKSSFCAPLDAVNMIGVDETKTISCTVNYIKSEFDGDPMMLSHLDACFSELFFTDPGGREYSIIASNRIEICKALHAGHS